jgi:hypothetical protein
MRRSRLQFRLSTLLWITLAVACWLFGMRVQKRIDEEPLPGDLATLTIPLLPPLQLEQYGDTWYVEGPMGPVEIPEVAPETGTQEASQP